MATSPDYPGTTLSRAEIAWIVGQTGFGSFRAGGGTPLPPTSGVPVPSAGGSWDPATIAIAIAHAESRGVTNAFNPESNNRDGGNDRGLWQINDKFHPEVTDAQAFDPYAAARAAHRISQGGRDWSQWATFGRLTAGELRSADAARKAPADPAEHLRRAGVADPVRADRQLPSPADQVLDAAGNVIGDALDWAAAAAKVLGALADPQWWRRIGVGVLGVGLVAVAVVAANKELFAGTARTVVTRRPGGTP